MLVGIIWQKLAQVCKCEWPRLGVGGPSFLGPKSGFYWNKLIFKLFWTILWYEISFVLKTDLEKKILTHDPPWTPRDPI